MQILQDIVLATHNQGKLREFRGMLAPYHVRVVSAGELGLPSPEETGTTFAENALLKAKAASSASGMLALADDSGLCVAALNSNPGIYSARWADPQTGFMGAMQRIQNELGDRADRSAYFICVLALYWPNGYFETIEGRVDGTLSKQPRGSLGHGYDPIFIPYGQLRTFGEMSEQEKNAISHRGIAMKLLIERFFSS